MFGYKRSPQNEAWLRITNSALAAGLSLVETITNKL